MSDVALITGGSRGIGLGIARELAQGGYDLVICGRRDEASVAQVIGDLQQWGAKVVYCQGDIGCTDGRAAIMATAREQFGKLNVLVNNAGIAPQKRADLLETTQESFAQVMRINAQGPFFLTQLAARWMIQQKELDADWRGCIVNISSISATVASINRGEYCISKAALSMTTKLWAVRLGAHGIPVYEVRPGIIKTDMTDAVQAKYDKLIAEGLLLEPRWGTTQDVGRAVAMLVGAKLSYATGQVLVVDGGLTMQRL